MKAVLVSNVAYDLKVTQEGACGCRALDSASSPAARVLLQSRPSILLRREHQELLW